MVQSWERPIFEFETTNRLEMANKIEWCFTEDWTKKAKLEESK